ncbi:hypothetical protein Mapa_011432 [Marchantia paleacea]|nr:hypothetical protein Mapa_011432 [Marchantia paleacea]
MRIPELVGSETNGSSSCNGRPGGDCPRVQTEGGFRSLIVSGTFPCGSSRLGRCQVRSICRKVEWSSRISKMREVQRNLLLVRRILRAVIEGCVPYTAKSVRPGCAASRSLWSWSGPDCIEGWGLAKPQAFLSDGSLKMIGGDYGRFSVLRHSRGAKINGSEVIMLFLAFVVDLDFSAEARGLCNAAPEQTTRSANVKSGFIIMRKGRITQVLKTQHTQQGRGGATIQVELRDVRSGLKSTERLRTGEAIEKVFVDDRVYTFLYEEGDTINLMEPNTFEQLEVPKAFFGLAAAYLTDGMEVKVQYFDGKPMSATVPDRVTCTVVEAEPYFKGQAATPQCIQKNCTRQRATADDTLFYSCWRSCSCGYSGKFVHDKSEGVAAILNKLFSKGRTN